MERRIRAIILIIGVAIFGMSVLCSCGVNDIDISGYGDEEIILRGISSEDIIVTIDDLKALKCKTIRTESTSDKIGTVKATGPELDTLLAEYGVSKSDFAKIKIYGSDEYDCRLQKEYFTEHDMYLAFGINGEPLDAESAPCRLIIPESDSAYWVRMINMIEFE